MTFGVKEQVFGFDVSMGDALAVQVRNPCQDLFETTLHFARRHAPLLDRRIQIATRTELHDLAPLFVLVLDQVNSFNDVDVVQRRGNAEFGGQFLDVFLFGLIFTSLPKFLDSVQFLL